MQCECLSMRLYFFFRCCGGHRDLHSFPTRRSSDLVTDTDQEDGVRAIEVTVSGEERIGCPIFAPCPRRVANAGDRKSTRLNSSHSSISYAVFCLKKKTQQCMHYRQLTLQNP